MQPVPKWKFVVLAAAVFFLALWPIYQTVRWYSLPAIDRHGGSSPAVQALQKEYDDVQKKYELLVGDAKVSTATGEERAAMDKETAALRDQKAELTAKLEAERNKLERLSRSALKLGLDLQGGIHAVMRVKTEGMESYDAERAVMSIMTKIQSRLDQKNIQEPVIQKQGDNYIVVQIAGISDPKEFRDLIGTVGRLEFKVLYDQDKVEGRPETGGKDRIMAILSEVDSKLGTRIVDGEYVTDKFGSDVILDEDFVRYVRSSLFNVRTGEMTDAVKEIVDRMAFGYSLYMGQLEKNPGVLNGRSYRSLYLLKTAKELGGEYVKKALVMKDEGGLGQMFAVTLEFDRTGARRFKTITGDNVGKRLAVVLDNTVFSAPVIREVIPGGTARISGDFALREASTLAVILQEGALPAEAVIEELRAVDPMLGADSIRKGVKAGIVGAILVIIFMFAYYLFCGAIADVTLVLSFLFLVGLMCLLNATLTLPGIAGLVLFVGMAVDANVLIYERIREEVKAKPDRAIGLSVERGYHQAFRTIMDSNVTTLITALVLFQFGTGPVKGFAVSLTLGIIISMVVGIIVTRMFIDYWTNNLGHKSILIGGWDYLQGLKIDFLKYRNPACIISAITIVVGLTVLGINRDRVFGIDFTGGTLMRIGFDKDVDTEMVREALANTGVTKTETRIQKEKTIGIFDEAGELQRGEGPELRSVFQVRFKEPLTFDDLKMNEALAKIGRQDVKAERVGTSEEQVGGQITGQLRTDAYKASIFATLMMIIYVSVRFEFGYALAAVASLFHDVLISAGLFALASVAGLNVELNLPEVAALLTIFGYSINDTIVIFDRIRETIRPGRTDLRALVNQAVNETLPRTMITSFTTIMTAFTLLVFGGPVIFGFSLMMMFGLVTGSYSTIFIASPILILWKNWRARVKEAALMKVTA